MTYTLHRYRTRRDRILRQHLIWYGRAAFVLAVLWIIAVQFTIWNKI